MTDLERFVEQPGRAEAMAEVARRIEAEGITYVYFQFVSVTGRVMGKGIPAAHWSSVATKGFQLVYGATANLFIDRHGQYIGYGPEAAELVGLPDVDTFCPLPWDPQRGPGLLHALPGPGGDGRRRRLPDLGLPGQPAAPARRVHGRDRPPSARRVRARDDVAQDEPGRHALGRGVDQAVLLPHRPVLRAPAGHPQGDRVLRRDGPRHDPGRPRGRTRTARAELHLRPGRGHGRSPHHLPPGVPSGRSRVRPLPLLHAQALHGCLGQRLPPQLLAVGGGREHVPPRRRGPPPALQDRAARHRRRPRPTCAL